MGAKPTKKPGSGPSTHPNAVKVRKERFRHELIRNGGNQTAAAIAAGYSKSTARSASYKLSAELGVGPALQASQARLLRVEDLTTDRILLEMGRVATFDPRRLYNDDETLKKPSEWDDDVAAVVASMDVDNLFEGRGEDREKIGTTRKIRLWDKISALEKLARVHGLFERDNRQKRAELSIEVEFVGVKPRAPKIIDADIEVDVVSPSRTDRGDQK